MRHVSKAYTPPGTSGTLLNPSSLQWEQGHTLDTVAGTLTGGTICKVLVSTHQCQSPGCANPLKDTSTVHQAPTQKDQWRLQVWRLLTIISYMRKKSDMSQKEERTSYPCQPQCQNSGIKRTNLLKVVRHDMSSLKQSHSPYFFMLRKASILYTCQFLYST